MSGIECPEITLPQCTGGPYEACAAEAEQAGEEGRDKYAHCLLSCCLSAQFGPGATICASVFGKEVLWDWWLGQGTPARSDALANFSGCGAYETYIAEHPNATASEIVDACRIACNDEYPRS